MKEQIRGKYIRKTDVAFWILGVLYTICYVSLIFNRNVWTDEAYTIQLVRENNFIDIIRATAQDVHPPFYYLSLKLFVFVFGQSISVYKLFSVIPMILTMILAWTYVRKWWGSSTAVSFLVLLNAIPCLLEYVVQIRMYSWALFFVTWAGLSAYGVFKEQKLSNEIQLTIASLLACYTHNYAMLSCVCIYLVLAAFMIKKTKMWLISGSFISLCYIPWLLVLYNQTTQRIGNYWIEPVTGKEIAGYFRFLFASDIPYSTPMFLIVCVIGVIWCISNIRRMDQKGIVALTMLGIPIIVAMIGIIVSVMVTPFFIARYLVPCLGLLALFMAISFSEETKKVQILLGVFGVTLFISAYHSNYQKEYHSTKTEELLLYMEQNMGENDVIIYNYEIYGFIYKIYFDANRTIFLNDMDFSQKYDNIWYFDSCVSPWLDSQVLENNGLTKELIGKMGIEQNDFALYKISHK